jgi:hypothetical protein
MKLSLPFALRSPAKIHASHFAFLRACAHVSTRGARARSRRLAALLLLLVCTAYATSPAKAAPPRARVEAARGAPAGVPAPLAPWVDWALRGAEQERCIKNGDVPICVFPTSLTLDAEGSTATFAMRVSVEHPRMVPLPGSTEHFPLDVRDGKTALAVVDVEGVPTAFLSAGEHTIQGRFAFRALPDSLQLPPNLATLTLNVDKKRVTFPKREANGLLWLKQSAGGTEQERLSLSVHRRIDDAIPLRLTTRVHVSAAGKAREVVLNNVLVAGTRPIELRTSLPAELTATGTLRIQVQAGEHDLEIVAICEIELTQLSAPKTSAPWPERELWVLKSDDRLRHLELRGPSQIDPARTDIAPDWRGMPTYVMPATQTLKLITQRRGEPEPPPNTLHLERTLWLDLDGDGYTVRDTISGTLRQGFRLDLVPAPLSRAVDHGHDQLVTRFAGKSGVELRTADVSLDTEWRLEHGQSELPAVGYNEDVQSLSTSLYLPPGYRLIAAEGVDEVPETWLDGWDLFDFFFVLLVALAVGRVIGAPFGLLALVALVSTHHDPEAPTVSWVALLIMSALLVALKRERFAKWLRVGWLFAAACVVLVLLPFSVAQIRNAIYPHLDENLSAYMTDGASMKRESASPTAAMPAAPAELDESEASGGAAADVLGEESRAAQVAIVGQLQQKSARSPGKSASSSAWESYRSEVDPAAAVQTGPGLPAWSLQQHALTWSGPVQKDQRFRLWIASPNVTRAWSLLSVLSSALLLFAFARVFRREQTKPPSLPPAAQNAAAAVALLFGVVSGLPSVARAQTAFPSSELINELRSRLLEPDKCAPDCLSVASLALRVEPSRLTLVAEVHAQARATYQAPGPLDSWAPDSVRVDGKDALAALRGEEGFLHVRVEPGVHKVELSGPLAQTQAFTLALGTRPHRVEAEHAGFVIEGLREDGSAQGSLSIRREITQGSDGDPISAQGLVQWFEVRREIELGVRFRLRTLVKRLGPAHEGALVRVPLLPGEAVSEAGLVSEKGSVVIDLPRGESERAFSSSLAPVAKLKLTASAPTVGGPLARPFSEVWVIAPSVLYRVTFAGLAPVARVEARGRYAPEYRPYPKESLTINTARLPGAEGASVTIDKAEVTFKPGSRIEGADINLDIRTSRGTTEHLALPKDAVLTHVSVDGADRPARPKDQKLELHLDPGAHRVSVTLQRPGGLDTTYRPFALSSGRPLTNVRTHVQMPAGRWLLYARGPGWGPAVLFWGYLIVVLLSAGALGQLKYSPLKTHQWMLLGLGLTQIEAPVALLIVGWLFALAYREHHWPEHPIVFNLTQIALALLTVIALVCLGYAVHSGLVVQPNMQVKGMDSTDQLLKWYADRTGGAFPEVTIWSAPLWVYKALMLLWALWLASRIIFVLRWGFASMRAGGGFRTRPKSRAPLANPQVALAEIEAAEAELKRKQTRPGSEGSSGPEGAGVP